jgi:hypothetical protein
METFGPKIAEVLESKGECFGADAMPFATAYFLWLEKANRLAEIMSMGPHSEKLFYEFLKVRTGNTTFIMFQMIHVFFSS